MDFTFTTEQRQLRESVAQFARERLNEGLIERDRAQEFRRDLWVECAQMGLCGLPVPEEYGGTGLDPLSTAIALEALGHGCRDGGLVFSICAHLLSCVVPLWKHGSEAQKRRYLPGLCDGSLIGVHAMTEPGAGSDAFNLSTRAERDGDDFVINGTKIFISNGPIADLVIVFTLTDAAKGFHGGTTPFLVEKGTKGFRVAQRIEKMGLRTSPLGELVFEDVRVPASAAMGGIGGGAAMFTQAMDWERTLLFAAQVGTIERLLDTAIEYARTRQQFGQIIGKFQGVSHKIADLKVQLEAARLLTYRAASRLETSRAVSLDAAMAKLFVSETLVRAALDVVQIHGGYGYTSDYEVERALRDAVGSTLYSGTSEIQRNIIARWVGL